MNKDEIRALRSGTRRGGPGGGSVSRQHGVIERRTEIREGVEYQVEVLAPESFPSPRTGPRGKGKFGSYANPKIRSVAGPGSGSGLWTGSQGDQTLLNSCMRDTRAARIWKRKHGSLVAAPWQVLGRRALYRAVAAARSFEAEYCPVYEQQHVLEEFDEDLTTFLERERGAE